MLQDNQSRARDDKRLEEDPESWKDKVNLAVYDEGAKMLSKAVVQEHRETQKDEAFSERASSTGVYLLTKRRFKSYKKFWYGQSSESASEEFDELREAASSDMEGCVALAICGSDESSACALILLRVSTSVAPLDDQLEYLQVA